MAAEPNDTLQRMKPGGGTSFVGVGTFHYAAPAMYTATSAAFNRDSAAVFSKPPPYTPPPWPARFAKPSQGACPRRRQSQAEVPQSATSSPISPTVRANKIRDIDRMLSEIDELIGEEGDFENAMTQTVVEKCKLSPATSNLDSPSEGGQGQELTYQTRWDPSAGNAVYIPKRRESYAWKSGLENF
ncbi:hypothetical protein HDU82_008193 [Entophlyctis luteolus]|nr:hypothetical protein HDU82_008193 [Entophlyctis luteolus]